MCARTLVFYVYEWADSDNYCLVCVEIAGNFYFYITAYVYFQIIRNYSNAYRSYLPKISDFETIESTVVNFYTSILL